MGRDPGKVVSDGDRVELGGRTGTVRKVMTDGRSAVEWDDGTSPVLYSGELTKIPRCGCAHQDALFRETIHDTRCPASMWAAVEFGVPAARAGQSGTILIRSMGAERIPTLEAMRRAIIAFERTGEFRAPDHSTE